MQGRIDDLGQLHWQLVPAAGYGRAEARQPGIRLPVAHLRDDFVQNGLNQGLYGRQRRIVGVDQPQRPGGAHGGTAQCLQAAVLLQLHALRSRGLPANGGKRRRHRCGYRHSSHSRCRALPDTGAEMHARRLAGTGLHRIRQSAYRGLHAWLHKARAICPLSRGQRATRHQGITSSVAT